MDDAIDEHKIVAGAVKVAEVASDSVGADEMIETDAFNLTSTSGTFGGVISRATQPSHIDFTSTSGTFGRLRGDQQIAEVIVTAGAAGANNVSWPFTFAGAPTVTITQETSSTAAYAAAIEAVTTTGATMNLSTAGTYHLVAIYHP